MNKKLHVRTGDTVKVLSGKDKNKKGKILSADPKNGKVIVEGVNMTTKHKKPRSATEPGGIIHQESAIYASKVMLVCAKCGAATRTGRKVLENGEIIRYCKKCNETV
jgi:large subunit ribosomal protein L24